jgi:hypothetical protein
MRTFSESSPLWLLTGRELRDLSVVYEHTQFKPVRFIHLSIFFHIILIISFSVHEIFLVVGVPAFRGHFKIKHLYIIEGKKVTGQRPGVKMR